MRAFASLLRRLHRQHKDRYPTVRAFAAALNLDETHLSRAMGPRGLPFDVLRCLRLAELTGESAIAVLRVAGKKAIADHLDRLFGEQTSSLTVDQRELLAAYAAVQPHVRQAVLVIVKAMARGEFYRQSMPATTPTDTADDTAADGARVDDSG